jgi:hypothetical protein
MSTDEDDGLTDDQILDLPMQVMPGDLSRLWSARANIIHEREFKEFILELHGGSSRHLMFPDQDPVVKRQREEEARRRAVAEMQAYEERSARLLARIDEQERVIAKRRQEIEDKAIKLHDGRRVYVDGNQYRDEKGNILQGSARDEAADLHRGNSQASTWQQKKDIDDRYAAEEKLRQKVLQDRDAAARRGDVSAANDKLTTEEKEFQNSLETTQIEIAAKAPTDLAASYSTDYMASYGDEYTISTVPAFTKAAQQTGQQTDKQTETETAQTKIAPQPNGQGPPKLG